MLKHSKMILVYVFPDFLMFVLLSRVKRLIHLVILLRLSSVVLTKVGHYVFAIDQYLGGLWVFFDLVFFW